MTGIFLWGAGILNILSLEISIHNPL